MARRAAPSAPMAAGVESGQPAPAANTLRAVGADAVLARLVTIQTLLAQSPSCQRARIAQLQADALIAMSANSRSMSKDERASLSAMACKVGFPDAVLTRVLESFAPQRSSRRGMQDFISFIHYLTEGDWAILLNPDTPMSVARSITFARLSRLGMRLPKEHTIKMVCSLCLFVTTRDKTPEEVPIEERKAQLKVCKGEWSKLMAKTQDPVLYLEVLPHSCAQFLQEYQDLARIAYRTGESPCPCKVDINRLEDFDRSTACRSSPSSALAMPVARTGTTLATQGGGMNMTDLMGMMMMQQQMMSMIFGGLPHGSPTLANGANAAGQQIPGLTVFGRSGQGPPPARPGDVLSYGHRVPSLEDIVGQSRMPPVEPSSQAIVPYTGADGHHGRLQPRDAAAEAHAPMIEDAREEAHARREQAAPLTIGMAVPGPGKSAAESPAKVQKVQSVTDVLGILQSKAGAGDDNDDDSEGAEPGPRKDTLPVARPRGRPPKKGATPKHKRGDKKAVAPKKGKPAPKAATKGVAAAKSKPAAASGVRGNGKPTFSVEWTRDQVLGRTGLAGPGQNVTFRFKDYKTIDQAVAAARKWVNAQKKLRNIA